MRGDQSDRYGDRAARRAAAADTCISNSFDADTSAFRRYGYIKDRCKASCHGSRSSVLALVEKSDAVSHVVLHVPMNATRFHGHHDGDRCA